MLPDVNLEPMAPAPLPSLWRRLAPSAAVLALMALAYAFGFHRYLTLQSISENRAALETFTAQNWLLALAVFMAVYIAAVALSFPGAAILTVLGGLLFGWIVTGLAVVASATLGAVFIFVVVRTALGGVVIRKAGPMLGRISTGFARDAFSYLLFLRLVPLFPFWLVNIAAGVANVRLRSFVSATAIGIAPATFTFAYLGQGLDSVLKAQQAARAACIAEKGERACPQTFDPGLLVTSELMIAFAALGILALVPAALHIWRPRP